MLKSLRPATGLFVLLLCVFLTAFTCNASDGAQKTEESEGGAAAGAKSELAESEPAEDKKAEEKEAEEKEAKEAPDEAADDSDDPQAATGKLDEATCKAACAMIKKCTPEGEAFDHDKCLTGCPTVDHARTQKMMRCMASTDTCDEAKSKCEG